MSSIEIFFFKSVYNDKFEISKTNFNLGIIVATSNVHLIPSPPRHPIPEYCGDYKIARLFSVINTNFEKFKKITFIMGAGFDI